MKHQRLLGLVLVFSIFCLGFYGCGGKGGTAETVSSAPPPQSKTVYLKNNIHTQSKGNEYRANYENWTNPGSGHVIFPVNTAVEVQFARFGFYLTDIKTGRKIDYEYNDNGMGGMSTEEYVRLITSREPVNLKGLSDADRRGISDGKAYIGMSKEGVRIALGYPAVNRTPSLSSSTWVFAKNRWTSTAITFDDKGRVRAIR
ncbi:MAG TPA: hypothetical protein VHO84_07750 [Syntrophorhabdaceae bacterium]|nr:hypothetical protein [Syntrophorhabdaceae bacterium]